ncbi:response regulator [Ferrovibrio terrae]|uniref:response regulator transcription factor n=1 Tax=Ferrovibrio terrae TaxID=2594003 RepID=UPI0031383578
MDDRLISIIDDDESLRLALVSLVRSLGYRASGFASAEDFLNSGDIDASSCLITDIQMPGLSGIELKHLLVERHSPLPVIMITGRADPALRDKALASGAICLLKKPFEAAALLDCIERALAA